MTHEFETVIKAREHYNSLCKQVLEARASEDWKLHEDLWDQRKQAEVAMEEAELQCTLAKGWGE